jgi:hypothetical protein
MAIPYIVHNQLPIHPKSNRLARANSRLSLVLLACHIIIGESVGHLLFPNGRQGKECQAQPILGKQAASLVVRPLPGFGHNEAERGAGVGVEGDGIARFQVTDHAVGDTDSVIEDGAEEPDGDRVV